MSLEVLGAAGGREGWPGGGQGLPPQRAPSVRPSVWTRGATPSPRATEQVPTLLSSPVLMFIFLYLSFKPFYNKELEYLSSELTDMLREAFHVTDS